LKLFAHGKLLLTSEYLVVKGAKALAVPTKMGQHLELKESSGSELNWKSLDHEGNEWFSAQFDLMSFDCMKTTDEEIAGRLRKMLRAVCNDNSDFLSKWKKYRVTTRLDFPRDWGLGTSSTLIYLLSTWAEANPYFVYFDLFEGSGYDVACANAEGPLVYQFTGDNIHLESCGWKPGYLDKLYIIHLGQKQDTSTSLREFLKLKVNKTDLKEGTELTEAFLHARSLSQLEKCVGEHESLLSTILKKPTIKEDRFSDYWGQVKSLGAWGGDMALVTSNKADAETKEYFSKKGISIFEKFEDFVLL
jgi:mevalonate kinase